MERRKPPLVLVLLLLCVPLVWGLAYWFVCDDAFISFRYARNLLRGEGLVYNPGEYVEGYTNFLWVLEIAGVWALGLRPEAAAPLLGMLWTVVTGVTLAALAVRSPVTSPWSRWVAPLALLLWCTNRSVAVWVTSGLETRQFTALVTLGLYAVSRWRDGRGWLALGSTLYALAALTRPEALLIGPMVLLWAFAEHLRARRVDLRSLAAIALPFAVIVGVHLLWRHGYYGEWLPNTYYAKNVRPWWDAGGAFLGLVAIEHALYLSIPLAIVGTRARARHGDYVHFALWIWAIPTYLHVAKIGGDHFEFRMFDELWPALALASADGLLALGAASRGRLVALTVTTVVLSLAVPLSHDRLAFQRESRSVAFRMKVPVDLENSPWLAALPPIPFLLPIYNHWAGWLPDRFVGTRAREHQIFARRNEDLRELEDLLPPGLFAAPAVTALGSIGAAGFYLPDVVVIDLKGLTDATVARNPVTTPNAERRMAHDRDPPPGYLARRGVNFQLGGVKRTRSEALRLRDYAVELRPGAWMAFGSPRPQDLPAMFAGRRVHSRQEPLSSP